MKGTFAVYSPMPQSFMNIGKWLQDIQKYGTEGVFQILVGTKADLESQRQVSREEAKAFAERQGLQYLETSAKDDKNVVEAFLLMASSIVARMKAETIHEEAGKEGQGGV